jgi:hypothetical protein
MSLSLEWMLIRGSGLVAYLLLAASVLWGLVLSLGVLPRSVKNLTLLHESLSVGALVATLVHMIGIAFDEFIDFDAAAVLVPGRAPWKPMAVAWGVAAFYGMVVVILSFYIRKHIGQSTWRSLHYLSFGVFLSALVHGLTAGTDTANPWVFTLYAATGAAVVALVVLRVVMAGHDGSKGEPARAPRTAAAAPRESPPEAPGTTDDGTPASKPRIPAEALAAARAARSTTPRAEADAAPDEAPAAPAAVPPATKQRIPEHLLARARAAKEAAGQTAEDPGRDADVEPALVGAGTTEAAPDRAASADAQPADPAPRKSRIPAEALAKAAELRKARDGGSG